EVNIIGEHTDYNGGLVMPFCIDKGIYAAINKNTDMEIKLFSENFSIHGIINISLEKTNFDKMGNFGDYLLGAIKELKQRGYVLKHGLNIVLSSNLPVGGGLSSSAALTVLLLKIFDDEYSFKLNNMEIVKIAKAVENNFLGVSSGIMDQFAIVYGMKNNAIYLNTKTMDYEFVPLVLNDCYFILINSSTSRSLKESKYNIRQAETQEVLNLLKNHYQISCLSEIKMDRLEEALLLINDEVLKNRLKHVVTENNRVDLAKRALKNNDMKELGRVLTEAHYSLKNDYEVSTPTLDELVQISLESGALGARMIGGGFGGSTLNLVLKANFEGFIDTFNKTYQKKYEKQFIYSIVYAKDGIKEID
ncbi:MAG: galactokinase, partial [Candidatus Izemoplasmatales bacterium]